MLSEETGVMRECRAQEWFIQFRSGNLDVKDGSRFGRPITRRVDEMIQMVDHKPTCKLSTDGIISKNKLLKEA